MAVDDIEMQRSQGISSHGIDLVLCSILVSALEGDQLYMP